MSAAGAVGSAPLAGITVIDFSELLPGPFFTQNLAELGARVIKIEKPRMATTCAAWALAFSTQ